MASHAGCADARMNAAIGDDFNVAIGQQHVHEHAVVALGIPYPQQTEHLERPFARCRALPDAGERQRGLDREAQLTRMTKLAFGDRVFDAHHFLRRKGAMHVAAIGDEVTPKTPQPRRS